MKKILFVICLWAVSTCTTQAEVTNKPVIRIGVQSSGTFDWEVSLLDDDPDSASGGFILSVQRLATPEAGKISLQAKAVDIVVADWIWVSKMRSTGNDLAFYPYSSTSGALIVANDSPIQTVKDLNGKRLGIVGGELDKNWLLLQALAKQQQFDLNQSIEKVFGAPPLITEQIKQKHVDAALTYWHFAARLEAQGYRQIIDGKELLSGLGISETVPTLGYVFNRNWALNNKSAVNAFLRQALAAKRRLCSDDEAWRKVLPLTRATEPETQKKLRARYCEGIVSQWGEPEQAAAEQIYNVLRLVSGSKLTGASEHIQPGTFWNIDE